MGHHIAVAATAAIWPDGRVIDDAADGPLVGRVHGEVFGTVRPASGFIVVKGFLDPRWRVEIEADAIVDE